MSKENDTNADFENIAYMIQYAHKEGLLVEVIWSYTSEIRNGIDIEQACANALNEWDI